MRLTIPLLVLLYAACASCTNNAEPVTESLLKPTVEELKDSTLFKLVHSAYNADTSPVYAAKVDSFSQVYSYNEPGMAYAFYRRGVNEYKDDQFEQATSNYHEALARYLDAEELELQRILRLQLNLANLMSLRGINDSIIYFTGQALQLVDDYPGYDHDKDDLIDVYLLGGIAYQKQGDLKIALDYFQSGGELCEANAGEYYTMGRFESEYGRTLAMAGKLERAEERILRSLDHLDPEKNTLDSDDEKYRGDAFRAYCAVFSRTKAYGKMEEVARAAHSFSGRLQTGTIHEADDLNNIGYALVYQNKLTEGRKFLQRALAIYQKNGEQVSQGHTYENFAEAARQEKDYEAGIRYLRKAESCYHGIPDQPGLESALNPEKMIEATMEIANYGVFLHQKDSAAFDLPSIVIAAARVDSLLGLLRYSVRSEESKRLLVKKLRPFHEQLLAFSIAGYEQTADQGYLDLGLHYLARSKAQVLNERKVANQLLSLGDGREELYTGQREILQLKDRYQAEKVSEKRTLLLEELQRKEFKYRLKVEELLGHNELDYSGLPDEPVARSLQASLSQNDLVLDYFVGDSLVFAGVYSPNEVKLEQLSVSAVQLKEHVLKISEMLQAPINSSYLNSRNFRDSIEANYLKSSTVLFQSLLADQVHSTNSDHLTILLDGVLHQLPFSSLLTDTVPKVEMGNYSTYPFVLGDYVINYEFSLQAWLDRLTTPRTFPTDHLVVSPTQPKVVNIRPAGTTKSITLASLTASEPENESVADLIDARTLRKTGANRAKFMRIASNFGIIHFSGHGIANADDPYQSFLVFSESGTETTDNDLLYLRDLERLQLQADLLVLSACQTATGQLSQGEGVISLGRAGALAGAGSVIASSWAVNQEAKAAFFPLFYEQLIAGQRRDEAIQRAKLRLIQTDERLAHPYYWAGFENFGDGRVVAGLTD